MKCFQVVQGLCFVVMGSLFFGMACGSRATESGEQSQLSSTSALSANCAGNPTIVHSNGQITVSFNPELSLISEGAPTVRKRCVIQVPFNRKDGKPAQVLVTPSGFYKGAATDYFFYSARMALPGFADSVSQKDITINQSQSINQAISLAEPMATAQQLPNYSGTLEIQISMTLRSTVGGSPSAGISQLSISIL